MQIDVTLTAVADLAPYSRNARKHTTAAVGRLVQIIEEMGWTNPILVDDDGIVAGHKRRLAALAIYEAGGTIRLPNGQELPAGMVPTLDVSGWSEAQRRAYIIADNQTTLESEWDLETLRIELSWLEGAGVDMGLTGFDGAALTKVLLGGGRVGNTDPDDIPPEPDAPTSKPGDIWQLGDHRITCGDSTSANVVAALLDGAKPHLMVTDPPYGVEYDPAWRNKVKRPNGKSYGAMATGKVLNDDRADWRAAWALFPGEVAYVWQGDKQLPDMALQLADNGFAIRNLIVWAKTRFVISRGDYHSLHETCWYAVRKGGAGHWSGDRKQTTLWQIEHAKSDTGHGTQKPVECMKRPIENNSEPGDAVYEPFSGSGTTIIAAEITGRHCYAVELNPAYVDVAVRRWQEFTGREATLVSSGATFDEVAELRAVA